MKTTKNLFKTVMMSLMLASCLGANAMAEENVLDEKGMEVKLNLTSTFTWNIPSEIAVNQNELTGKNFYETNFDISINSVTLASNERVKVVIGGESGNRYNDSEKKFYMSDFSNYANRNKIYYYIQEAGGEDNIGTNEELLSVTAGDFAESGSPVKKTLKIKIPCDSSLSYAGSYQSNITFQAQIVNMSA